MKVLVKSVLLCLAFGVIGAVAGALGGSMLSSYIDPYQRFKFFGNIGYEAWGLLFFWVGLLGAAALGVFVGTRKKKS